MMLEMRKGPVMVSVKRALPLLMVLGASVIAGCTDRGAPSSSRSARTDTVVVCLSEEPASLYRLRSGGAATLQALLPTDPQGWRPDRAYGYETLMLEGGEFPTLENGGAMLRGEGLDAVLSVTFRFRPEIRWSDGEPFTVDDILFTRRVILDPLSGAVERGRLSEQSFEKVDDHTLRVSYPPGVVDPLYFLPPLSTANGISAPLPEHALRGLTPAEILESDYAHLPDPVLGPYEFVEWEEGDHITLRAVEPWWGGPVQIPTMVLRFAPDPSQLIALTESGGCDVAAGDALQMDDLPLLQEKADQGTLSYAAIPGLRWERIDMNTFVTSGGPEVLPFFANLRVRQAVAYGTNRAGMAEQALEGPPMTTVVPADHWAWNSETATLYPYDPAQAERLLEQAGWMDGDGDGVREASRDLSGEYSCGRGAWHIPAGTRFEVKLRLYSGDALRGQLASAFARNMARIGIKVHFDLMPTAPRFGEDGPLAQRPIQLGLFTTEGSIDPGGWLSRAYGGINLIRTPEGEVVNAYDLWQQRGSTLSRNGLTYEQLAFSAPGERAVAPLPDGYTVVQGAPSENLTITGWCDPQAEELLFKANSALRQDERAQALMAFQQRYAEQVPSLPLVRRVEIFAWAPNLCGPDLGPANTSAMMWNLAEWRWLPPGTSCGAGSR